MKNMLTPEQLDKNEIALKVSYTDDEGKYFNYVSDRMSTAQEYRDKNQREFNDLDYITRYDTNQDNYLAYTRKRKNEEERSIVTGTVRNKGKSLLSALLNYNLMPNFIAYDKNNEVIEGLGGIFDDLVKKSYEIEMYDKKRPLIYNEALCQGTWFTEEVFLEQNEVKKEITKELDVKKTSAKWKETTKKKPGMCVSRLIPGKKVYLGNIGEFFMENQPFFFTAETLDYNEAKSIFGDWERFQYVPRKVDNFFKQPVPDDKTNNDGVEVVKYYDPIKNEFQLFLNRVMMLPVQYPLSEVSPSGKIPVAKGDLDPTQWDFAYSKSFTDDTMFDQILLDDFIRTLVVKSQQALMPPMVNNTNRTLGRRIFLPGMITNNIDPNRLQPLLKTEGVSSGDVAMFEIIRKLVDEKSVSAQFTGDQTSGNQTATEILELKKQQMMKLGLVIWGIMEFEKSRAMLRLYNILANWTKPVDSRVDKLKGDLMSVYQTFSVDTTDSEGQPVDHVIEFSPEKADFPSDFVMREEEYLSKFKEKSVKITYVDPEWLRSLDMTIFVTITPTEKDSSELQQAMFAKSISEGFTLFGPQSFNMENLKQQWALKNKLDPNKILVKQQAVPMGMPGTGQLGQQMTAGANAQPQTPSLNQLLGKQ